MGLCEEYSFWRLTSAIKRSGGDNNHFDRFKKYLATARSEDKKDVFRISTQAIIEKFSGSLASYREFFKVKYSLES